ncbi:hypothetical protein BC629DRAFT_1725938 [Irpex lacteus]|nr:hypothetical protein BC629DRAFT_1725938 [Irpex lacteus]
MVPLRRGKIINFCSLLTYQTFTFSLFPLDGWCFRLNSTSSYTSGGLRRRGSGAFRCPVVLSDCLGIVNLQSAALVVFLAPLCLYISLVGGLTVPAYASAKGALGQLTKALANEWSKENVQVNGIVPGYIATDMNEKLLQDPTRLRQISERIPAGRWGQPADFAGPVVFLASDASQYVCGELLVVDGGWMGYTTRWTGVMANVDKSKCLMVSY